MGMSPCPPLPVVGAEAEMLPSERSPCPGRPWWGGCLWDVPSQSLTHQLWRKGSFLVFFLKVPFEMLIQPGSDLPKLHAYKFTSSTSMNSLFHYLSDLIRLLNLAGSFNLNENSSKDWCQLSFPPHCNYHVWVGSGCTACILAQLLALLVETPISIDRF